MVRIDDRWKAGGHAPVVVWASALAVVIGVCILVPVRVVSGETATCTMRHACPPSVAQMEDFNLSADMAGADMAARTRDFSAFQGEKRFALVIGHNLGGEGTRPLLFAEDDARKVASLLPDIGGFAPWDVRLLLGPDARTVRQSLEELERSIATEANRGKRSMLLVYYSGHASDGNLRLGNDRLPLAEIRRAASSSKADIRLVFIDACQSGTVTRPKGAKAIPLVRVRNSLSLAEPKTGDSPQSLPFAQPESTADGGPKGYVIVTSSTANELSQESDDIRGSLFSHHLVSGLRGAADREGDGRVTLAEAYKYAYDRTVLDSVATLSGTQHPTYLWDLRGTGQVILTQLGGGGALVFEAGGSGSDVVYDLGRDLVVAEVRAASQRPVRLRVAPGRYAIRRRENRDLFLQTVLVEPGETVGVRNADFEPITLFEDVTKGPKFVATARRKQKHFGAMGGLGLQAFFDSPTRESLFHPLLLATARLNLANWIAPGISLDVDASGGRRETTIDEYAPIVARVEYSVLSLGVGAVYDWYFDGYFDGYFGALKVSTGPWLSFTYFRRDFIEPSGIPFQSVTTLSPGWSLEVSLPLGSFTAAAESRVNYLHFAANGDDRSLGFGEFFVFVGL